MEDDKTTPLIHRMSKRRHNALIDLMATVHGHADDLPSRMMAVNRNLGRNRLTRMRDLLHGFLDTVRAEAIETLPVIIVAKAIEQWAMIEFNKALPPNARVDLPLLYEAVDEITAIWGEDEELVFDQMAQEIAKRGK